MIRILLFTIVLSSLLCSCFLLTKEEEKPPPPTRSDKLMSTPWKITDFGTDDNNNGKIDPAESDMPACDKDNYYHFNGNQELLVLVGADKCYTAETNSSATWSLQQNNTKLLLSLNAIAPIAYDIIDISFERLELHRTVNGKTYISYWGK
jgi:hypothetical protein